MHARAGSLTAGFGRAFTAIIGLPRVADSGSKGTSAGREPPGHPRSTQTVVPNMRLLTVQKGPPGSKKYGIKLVMSALLS